MLDLLINTPALRHQAAARERERIQIQYLWPEVARSIETTYYKVLGWSGDVPNINALTAEPTGPADRAAVI
jgi:hypothetical protein